MEIKIGEADIGQGIKKTYRRVIICQLVIYHIIYYGGHLQVLILILHHINGGLN